MAHGGKLLQIVRESHSSETLTQGFNETWKEMGQTAPTTIMLKAGETITKEALRQLLQKEKPVAILIWDGSGAVTTLDMLATEKASPSLVLVSGRQLGSQLKTISEAARNFTYITYPYRLPHSDKSFTRFIEPYKKDLKANETLDAILKSSFITTQLLTSALIDMRGYYYRDNFFDAIGMMPDQKNYPLYERLSFGPGQRYTSKGCYIVQLGPSSNNDIIKKSDWVIH